MIGQTISHYQIQRELGRGGMGVVYLAEDLRLGRQVAIKALPVEVSRDPIRRKRFEQEARACAALNHSAIAAVFDLEVSGEDLFIIFEYVDGDDLRAWLRRQPLETATLLRFAQAITRGLAAAHQAGIVHRDLKPENLRVNSAGEVKILDFGLARMQTLFTNEATMSMALTSQGTIVGTVGYMSPEQLESRELDARSDIFSLGVLLYEMAAGVHPFQGESPASTIANVLAREPAPIAHLNPVQPPALDSIVRKCLAKKREERYQSAAELLVALEDLQRGSGDAMKTVVMTPKTAAAPAAEQDTVLASFFSRLMPNVRSWWELHHIFMAVVVLGLFPALAWQMRGSLGGQLDLFFFFVVVIFTMIHFVFRAGMVLAVLLQRARQAETIQNLGPVVRLTHILLCLSVLFAAPKFVADHPLLGTVFAGIVIGGILVSLAIEPWMETNAFPQVAQLREELHRKDQASSTRGARRWWLTHHLSATLGWTPMMVVLPWMVRGWLPQANNLSDYIVFLCVILALQNFGLRAYVLEVAWFHREALETTVRKMATPLLVCNLLLATLCATMSVLLFKTHLPQAIGFMVMAVGAAMIVGVLERNFNVYAFPGISVGGLPIREVQWDDITRLGAMQFVYLASLAYLLKDFIPLMDDVLKWVVMANRPSAPEFGALAAQFLASLTALLFLGALGWGLLIQRRLDVVHTYKRWYVLFVFLDMMAMPGCMLFLARNTHIFVLLIGATLFLYGIRYQWILAKRILAEQKATDSPPLWNAARGLAVAQVLYSLPFLLVFINILSPYLTSRSRWLTNDAFLIGLVALAIAALAVGLLWQTAFRLMAGDQTAVTVLFRKRFGLFACTDALAIVTWFPFLPAEPNRFLIIAGVAFLLYGIRYQWILAKRILAAEAGKADVAAGSA